MATDFNYHIKQQHLLDQIVDELYENAQRYAPFYQGTKKEMIKKAELYSQDASKVYTDEIVDVIVCVTANVVGYNLAIFQNIGGQAIIIFTQCIDKNTSDTSYLKYDYCLGFDGANHYSAIVMKKPSSAPPSQPTSPPPSQPTSPPPSQPTSPPPSHPTSPPPSQPTSPPPSKQPRELQEQSSENEEPLNIEDIQNQIENLQNKHKKNPNKKRKRNQINMQNFENVQVNTVDELPWEIDGLQIYKKQSTMDFWWDETKDGRWWKVSDSSCSGLNGERKFLTCRGSYVCNNSTCSKLTSEGVKNRNHFIQAKGGGYTCHSCGYYVQKECCGVVKILEFDIDTNYITAYHYGNHICWPKPNKKQQLQYAEDATLNRDLHKTPRELKIDLIGYYLARDQIEKAVEVADKMSDNRVIEKLRYLTKGGGQKLLRKTDVDSFTNIKTLKETTDKKDKFYIYKLNCKSVSGEPSYVF